MILQESTISVEEVAASLAHEIKNPLALIKANLEVLEMKDTEAPNSKSYAVMYSEIKRIDSLMLELIEMTKVSIYNFDIVYIDEVVDEACEALEAFLRNRNVDLTVLKKSLDAMFYGDFDKIKSVIINLIKNAAEAIDCGGVVEITTYLEDNKIKLLVKDNGCGISYEAQQKLFTPFFTTKRSGTGMGMPICKRIVGGHSGEIAIESKEGLGTSVYLAFPVYEGV